jgi:molecular chaperone IbpA
MREIDFTPLFRSAIGFDRIASRLQTVLQAELGDTYPPYNIERYGEDDYRIVMAVAGFLSDELSVTASSEELTVCGKKRSEDAGHYLHRGVTARTFKRRFELAPFVKAQGAELDNGLLSIDLRREPPEEMRPCRIDIVCGERPHGDREDSGLTMFRSHGTGELAQSSKNGSRVRMIKAACVQS